MSGKHDAIVVGAGFAGSVVARVLADGGRKVLLLEQRAHAGGNCHDEYDDAGILIHTYGPHIYHTNDAGVDAFLRRFCEINSYRHEVVARIGSAFVPVPFNLNSLRLAFPDTAERKADKLRAVYGAGACVPILDLRRSPDPEIRALADWVYENIFAHYTAKQWGIAPDEIGPEVTARVPVRISDDDRFFTDSYQGLPADGYARLFERILDHPNITLRLNTDGTRLLSVDTESKRLSFEGAECRIPVVFTGCVDELLSLRFGRLPYRSARFVVKTFRQDFVQPKGVVNYTVSEGYTRVTEYKHMTLQHKPGVTSLMYEYPGAYDPSGAYNIPVIPLMTTGAHALYERYRRDLAGIPSLHLLGRLAEYRYYNIDAIVRAALDRGTAILARGSEGTS